MSDEIMWAYIAGFFDGEGTVGVYYSKGGRQIAATMHQSHEGVLSDIASFLRSRNIRCIVRPAYRHSAENQKTRKQKGWPISQKPSWFLLIQNFPHVPPFLRGIFPYLRVKKIIAQDVLRYCRLYPPFTLSQRGKQAMDMRYGRIARNRRT